MFIVALIGFIISFVGLCALFTFKYVEMSRGTIYVPHAQAYADRWARMIKAIMRLLVVRVERLPQDFVVLLHVLVHVGAVVFARGARAAEQGAHKLADRVSHKHRFEKGKSRSEFLKRVSEHKSELETKR